MGCNCNKPCGCSQNTSPCVQTDEDCSAGVLYGAHDCPDPLAKEEYQECTPGNCEGYNYPLYVKNVTGFNMPACGETAPVAVERADRLTPGMILFNDNVGYLTVVQIVSQNSIIVQNDCLECANDVNFKSPGQLIPPWTTFQPGFPPCQVDPISLIPSTTPFLALDYIIPAVGICTQMKVTGIFGLTVGDVFTVSDGGNTFSIGSIIDSTTIEACNDGDGGVPGDIIFFDPNNDEIPNWPLIRTGGENPCTSVAVSTLKRIVGCSATGQQQGLVGSVQGQVPFWNQATQQWELMVVEDTTVCATIGECCLTIDPDNEPCFEYLVALDPNTESIAAEFDKIQPNVLRIFIGNDPFCVAAIVDETYIKVIPAFDVTEITEYEEGVTICVTSCCEQCQPTIEVLDRFDSSLNGPPEVLVGTGTVTLTAPDGISTHTFPSDLADDNQNGFEEGAPSLWQIDYDNAEESCCECRKYIEMISNFETAVVFPAGLFVNVEFRVLKTSAPQNSQSFGAHPFVSPQPNITAGPYDLIPGDQTINTVKACVFDRDFIGAGQTVTFKGHIRIVVRNTTGAPVDFTFLGQWRAWIKVWTYKFANATVTP